MKTFLKFIGVWILCTVAIWAVTYPMGVLIDWNLDISLVWMRVGIAFGFLAAVVTLGWFWIIDRTHGG